MNYLVADTDSFTGVYRDAFFGWAYSSETTFDIAFLSGKMTSAKSTEAFAIDLSSFCPKVEIYKFMASSLKNHADMLCGVAIGRIVERCAMLQTTDNTCVFILSCDKLVCSLAKTAIEQGLKATVVSVQGGTMTVMQNNEIVASIQVTPPKTHPLCDRIMPEWASSFLTREGRKIGFACEKVPSEEYYQKPDFIPFPIDLRKFTIGKVGTFSLSAWDSPNRKRTSLLPKNVEIEYCTSPESSWKIRSLNGHKTGHQAIKIDGELLEGLHGARRLKSGTIVEIGEFKFKFRDNPVESYIRFESIREIRHQLEISLKQCCLTIPWNIIKALNPQGLSPKPPPEKGLMLVPLAQDFSNANFSVYGYIIENLLDWFPLIRKKYKQKAFFHNAFKPIPQGRTDIAHSSNSSGGEVPLETKRRFVEFLFLVREELANRNHEAI
jgi:hypothetical protein